MIIADRPQQIAMLVIQRRAQDHGGSRNIEAGFQSQPGRDLRWSLMGHGRNRQDPSRIDLHETNINRSIRILANLSHHTPFNPLNSRQDTGRKAVMHGGCQHAGQKSSSHEIQFSLLQEPRP